MSKSKLDDALNLIQRAEESMKTNNNDSYADILGGLVESFKQQLSQDHGLPMDFFEPVSLEAPIEEVPEELKKETETPENPELTPEAQKLYDDIIIAIGA